MEFGVLYYYNDRKGHSSYEIITNLSCYSYLGLLRGPFGGEAAANVSRLTFENVIVREA